MRIFRSFYTKNWSQMLNTEGTQWQLSSVLVGCFFFFVHLFFCIALLYKMCLEIVVIYSSRNTTGYTVVLWNSWDERELNRLLFMHCLVLWKQSQYFNKPKKRKCMHFPWWKQWRSLCYSIDASVLLSQVTCKSSNPGQLGVACLRCVKLNADLVWHLCVFFP